MANYYDAVYRLVSEIPHGRVMSYGQVAAVLGQPRGARAVGYALRVCPDDVPWQRVINRHGGISPGGDPARPRLQRELLEAEGVRFEGDTCPIAEYQWAPENPADYYYEGNLDFPFR